jgi:hypothetical protein
MDVPASDAPVMDFARYGRDIWVIIFGILEVVHAVHLSSTCRWLRGVTCGEDGIFLSYNYTGPNWILCTGIYI